MNKYICVHGHFYQPPRKNPWSKKIPHQESAAPYHDWNERITAECYAPNAQSHVYGPETKPADLVNNYEKMSFNFGPTLLSWLEEADPETYQLILDADRKSQKKFAGHGSAIAQGYNHMIMPLANDRDKKTQVEWGVRDFEHRFQRKSEGMWFPETAIDMRTLEIAADHGMKFTILAPNQALKVKRIGQLSWHEASSETLYTQVPYICYLPSGHKIVIFFYDGRISHEVAFGELLKNGEHFADRMLSEFDEHCEEPRLVHIATDGETYGHHHKFADMALSYFFHSIEKNHSVRITNYGEFLEIFPPVHEVVIKENSSWSCSHGIERWKSDCGCALESNELWNQKWRRDLREALDLLRDALSKIYEYEMKACCHYPWLMRDEYIRVVLDRSQENMTQFLSKFETHPLTHYEKMKALNLLEMQRFAMLMYTSCGWFFDDISGLETRQIIQYAGRAIELAEEVCGVSLENEFVNLLESAKSNVPGMESGKKVYELFVKSAAVH